MLPDFPVAAFSLLIGAIIAGVALAIALAGWMAHRLAPRVQLVVPYVLAALACWRAGVQTGHLAVGLPVIAFVLAAMAVTIPCALRLGARGAAGPAEPRLSARSPPRSPGAGVLLRVAFIAASAISGGLLVALQQEALGALGLAAATTMTWTLDRVREPSAADHRWPRRLGWAAALSVAALGVATVLRGGVLVGLPQEIPRLRLELAARIVAIVALASSAAMLVAREARRIPRVILVEALAVTVPLVGGAALLAGALVIDVSGLESTATGGAAFDPPRGWSERPGVPAPLRLYARTDGRESVTVVPVLLRGTARLEGWCREQDVAVAQALASATFGRSALRIHRLAPPRDVGDVIRRIGSDEDHSPCAFRADVRDRAGWTVAFRLVSRCSDERTVALLHAWSDDWENARGTTAVGTTSLGANEITRFVRCGAREHPDRD